MNQACRFGAMRATIRFQSKSDKAWLGLGGLVYFFQ
jgi:hypothetical protein